MVILHCLGSQAEGDQQSWGWGCTMAVLQPGNPNWVLSNVQRSVSSLTAKWKGRVDHTCWCRVVDTNVCLILGCITTFNVPTTCIVWPNYEPAFLEIVKRAGHPLDIISITSFLTAYFTRTICCRPSSSWFPISSHQAWLLSTELTLPHLSPRRRTRKPKARASPRLSFVHMRRPVE